MHDTSATRPTAPAGAPTAHGLTLLFVHGWAFDASFWDEVRAHLTLHLPSYPQQVLDAGYFGAPAQPGVLPAPPSGHWPAHAGPVIAIGHSLGAMQLLGRLPPRCAGLVMINGFARFCRSPDHPSGTPPRLLTRMLDKLAETPGEVVNDFRARCGAPACTRSPEPAALTTGLRALRDHDERAALAGLTLPVRLLAGQSDPLVPAPMSQALAIPDTHWHPGGHLLPLTDSAWCAERIVKFILSIHPAMPAQGPENQWNPPHRSTVTHNLIHKQEIAGRFGSSSARYDRHAWVQEHAALELARRIATLPLPPRPRILEIGCGTGLLTRELTRLLGPANWTVTDISPAMLSQAQSHFPAGYADFRVLDGEHPGHLDGPYDLICSSLAVQWFNDLDAGLARLANLLAPGGWLAFSTLADGTFREWRDAHEQLGWQAGTRSYPLPEQLGRYLPFSGRAETETLHAPQAGGLAFVRGLKAIGADIPAAGHVPLSPRQLRAVITRFDKEYTHVSYEIAYGAWRRPPAGVFVTGTDTGVGKTLACAVLAQAWQAGYWKPLQTGLAEESGDTDTVTRLAALAPDRVHAPGYTLQAPLSPWAAALQENTCVDIETLQLPAATAPLVVEGAGGLLVPVDNRHTMLDLIVRFGLPVVLVARSGLGTINHTLLSLQALAARRVPVLGVIMNGPPSPGNRQAIETFGKVRVLAEFPHYEKLDPATVQALAVRMPSLETCLEQ